MLSWGGRVKEKKDPEQYLLWCSVCLPFNVCIIIQVTLSAHSFIASIAPPRSLEVTLRSCRISLKVQIAKPSFTIAIINHASLGEICFGVSCRCPQKWRKIGLYKTQVGRLIECVVLKAKEIVWLCCFRWAHEVLPKPCLAIQISAKFQKDRT